MAPSSNIAAPEGKLACCALGLMSGTSLDGIDVAMIETDGARACRAGPSLTIPYAADFRHRLRGMLGGPARWPRSKPS